MSIKEGILAAAITLAFAILICTSGMLIRSAAHKDQMRPPVRELEAAAVRYGYGHYIPNANNEPVFEWVVPAEKRGT
jgi:hypothetical protein